MDLLDQPLASAEFVVVDTETNGRAGEECELTEVGAVLVGGGELHDRFETLVGVRAPLSRAIQRFTQITQDMVDAAPPAEIALGDLADLFGAPPTRVLVAHNAAFDRRVLRQAFSRAGLEWPDPPVVCTVALARRFAPLARQRRLAALAGALGVEVETQHRALADAETCARVFCALFGRLCAHADTVADALAALRPVRRSRPTRRTVGGGVTKRHRPDLAGLPDEPGVYLFRNSSGQVLYVGKSVALRTRARAHFAPSGPEEGWTEQAALADHRTTCSELGALVLEHRLIRELRPPGNTIHKRPDDPFVYLRCRLDIAFPVLEVAPEPAAGRAVTIGPLRGRAGAVELLEQLNSLFGLRHCGRTLRLRPWPSAYGQMGRCMSPCLNDLDPNLYRRRLDEALGLFTGGDGGAALLEHLERQMRAAASERLYERAAWLRRRHERIAVLVRRLAGMLAATHACPRLVLAPGPPRAAGDARAQRFDAFWLAGGRVADWAALHEVEDMAARTEAVVARAPAGPVAHLPADAIGEARIVQTWLAGHDAPALPLDPAPGRAAVEAFVREAAAAAG